MKKTIIWLEGFNGTGKTYSLNHVKEAHHCTTYNFKLSDFDVPKGKILMNRYREAFVQLQKRFKKNTEHNILVVSRSPLSTLLYNILSISETYHATMLNWRTEFLTGIDHRLLVSTQMFIERENRLRDKIVKDYYEDEEHTHMVLQNYKTWYQPMPKITYVDGFIPTIEKILKEKYFIIM